MTQKLKELILSFISFYLINGLLFAQVPITERLKFRVDASVLDSLTIDPNGRVSQWNDLSGNGKPIAQKEPGKQPIYCATGLNGLPSLTFNGGEPIIF